MAQFAPPPPQFASGAADGKPPLVPMQPMLPAGAEQPSQQQQPIWASSSAKRGRQRHMAQLDPSPRWSDEPQAVPTSQHSPNKRQREGPQDVAAAHYASEDAHGQQWDRVQPSDGQQPPEAAVSGDTAASARQRLQQLVRDVAPLVQQRAEV